MTDVDPRRLAVVAAAEREIGPGDIPKYWKSCHVAGPPYPAAWCGGFTLFCLHEAGLALTVYWIIALGYAEVHHLPRTKTPEPGDIFYKDQPYQHYGVVKSYDPATRTLVAIEGNTPTVQELTHHQPQCVFYSINPFLGLPAPKPAPGPGPAPAPAPTDPFADYLRGVDVSHHQIPAAIHYDKLAADHDFVIVRAAYGTKVDETFAEHWKRAGDAGLHLGAYSFFRASQDATEQLDAFLGVLDTVGYGVGHIPPALDIEQNTAYDGVVSAAHYEPAELVARGIADRYGAAMIYTNPAMWAEIGSPGWLKDNLLWISHYNVAYPTTPLGMPWALWQRAVAPLPGVAPGRIDQNIARVVPLLRAPTVPDLLPLEVDWEQLRSDRDALIQDT